MMRSNRTKSPKEELTAVVSSAEEAAGEAGALPVLPHGFRKTDGASRLYPARGWRVVRFDHIASSGACMHVRSTRFFFDARLPFNPSLNHLERVESDPGPLSSTGAYVPRR